MIQILETKIYLSLSRYSTPRLEQQYLGRQKGKIRKAFELREFQITRLTTHLFPTFAAKKLS